MGDSVQRTLWAAVFALLFLGAAAAQAAEALDLNGLWWTDDHHLVRVSQQGSQVRAVFVAGAECPNGGTRSYYLQGQLRGASLTGKLLACTRDPKLIADCSLTSVYETTFQATAKPGAVSGTRFAEGWAYDRDDSGRFVNCRRDARFDNHVPFSMAATTCAEALRKAEEEFRKWMGIWRSQYAASAEMSAEALKAYDEGSSLLGQQMAEELWSLLPIPVKVFTGSTPEDAADIAVDAAEDTARRVNPGDPVWARRTAKGAQKAGVIDFIVDWSFLIANTLTALGEGNRYSQSADRLAGTAQETLRKAMDYGLLVEALKKECPPQTPAATGSGDAPQPSTHDLGEAAAIMGQNAAAWSGVSRYTQAEIKAFEAVRSDLSQAKATLSQVPEGAEGSPGQGAQVARAVISALGHFAEAARVHGAVLSELKKVRPVPNLVGPSAAG